MTDAHRHIRRGVQVLCAVVGVCAVWGLIGPELAYARPGGGQSYSGGGGGGSGGGGDGGEIELLIWLIFLAIEYPAIGVPLLLVFGGFYIYGKFTKKVGDLDGTPGKPSKQHKANRQRGSKAQRRVEQGLGQLRKHDENFSSVVFHDFAYRLFASLHEARHDANQLARYAPYLNETSLGHLRACPPAVGPVRNVVIGAMQMIDLRLPDGAALRAEDESARIRAVLRYEFNWVGGPPGQEQRHFGEQRWILERAATARSKPPQTATALGCPNCGAPFQSADNRRCNYCGEISGDGRFDWVITGIESTKFQLAPPAMGGYAEEQGTDDPTIHDSQLAQRWGQLQSRDPQTNEAGLRARFETIYHQLNAAWTANRLLDARAYLSEGMFDYLRFWMFTYQEQGKRNRLEQMRVERLELVKVVSDKYFDAVTVRFWASGIDCTVEVASGKVVGGNPTRPRRYSEYWTLIRSRNTAGPSRTDPSCPNCSAPLQVTMAGNCTHCGAHLSAGEFDWVLSRIEQDEAYTG